MQIRTGFVSNSSTGSFVVYVRDPSKRQPCQSQLANKEDIEKLIEFGFKLSKHTLPSRISWLNTGEPKHPMFNDDAECFIYSTVVNENDVVYFLVKNNIPFQANCHYNDYFVAYERDSDVIHYANNFGIQLEGIESETMRQVKEVVEFGGARGEYRGQWTEPKKQWLKNWEKSEAEYQKYFAEKDKND